MCVVPCPLQRVSPLESHRLSLLLKGPQPPRQWWWLTGQCLLSTRMPCLFFGTCGVAMSQWCGCASLLPLSSRLFRWPGPNGLCYFSLYSSTSVIFWGQSWGLLLVILLILLCRCWQRGVFLTFWVNVNKGSAYISAKIPGEQSSDFGPRKVQLENREKNKPAWPISSFTFVWVVSWRCSWIYKKKPSSKQHDIITVWVKGMPFSFISIRGFCSADCANKVGT